MLQKSPARLLVCLESLAEHRQPFPTNTMEAVKNPYIEEKCTDTKEDLNDGEKDCLDEEKCSQPWEHLNEKMNPKSNLNSMKWRRRNQDE